MKKLIKFLLFVIICYGLFIGCLSKKTLPLAAFGSFHNESSKISSIEVQLQNSVVSTGTILKVQATAIYQDNSKKDVTGEATWSSNDTNLARINKPGEVYAENSGEVSIKAESEGLTGESALTIQPLNLSQILIEPVNQTLAIGIGQQFQAIGIFENNSNQELTSSVVWSSSDSSIVSIATNGLAMAVSQGSVTIYAEKNGIISSAILTISPPPVVLTSISVTPSNPSIPKGLSQQLTATGLFSDSSTQDITNQVNWVSTNTGIVDVSNTAGTIGIASGLGVGVSDVTATMGAITSTPITVNITSAELVSISISPLAPSIPKGLTQQFTAVGTYTDASTQDITSSVVWQSSNATASSISNALSTEGLATGLAVGNTSISAVLGIVTSPASNLTVSAAELVSISISPTSPSVAKGLTQQFIATGTYTDASTQDITNSVTWLSANGTAASISNLVGTKGLATAQNVGSSGITAGLGAITSSSTTFSITTATLVSIAISPANPTVVNGLTQQFTATGTYTDSSNQDITSSVTWSSSDVTKSTISNAGGSKGLATSVSAGTSNVIATLGAVTSSPSVLTIDPGDITPPRITNVASISPTLIRVTYSETVNSLQARSIANYKIADSPAVGNCTNNSNFTTGVQTTDFNITSINGTGTTYDISLDASQAASKSYALIANKPSIQDMAIIPNSLSCPNNADFIGQEAIKLSSAVCSSQSSIVVTFSKDVKGGIDNNGSAECSNPTECAKRYKISGAGSLGNINSANKLNGIVCGGLATDPTKVCIVHSLNQSGGMYTISVANGIDGDGFDNSSWGGIKDTTDSEIIQLSPKDRMSFSGCGIAPSDFASGPIVEDPFGDGTDFGYLNTYANKIYIGPNNNGNGASRFNADGSNPENLTFRFIKDTSGSRKSSNTANSRDGGIAVPDYVTLGHTGCTWNSANIATGCGPDNENGRGLFVSGDFGGTEYLFITAARETTSGSGDNDYLYYTSDLDTDLNFQFMDASDVFTNCLGGPNVSQNKVTESIVILNGVIFWNVPGDGPNRPFTVKISDLNSYPVCTAGVNEFLETRYIPGIGKVSSSRPVLADYVGGIFYTFNDRLYFANSGSITNTAACDMGTSYSAGVCEQTGGIVRSVNNNPGKCIGPDNCPDWTDTTPTSIKFKQFFSIGLPSLADLIPGQKPVPGIEEYKGNLYLLRNACVTSRYKRACTSSKCSDDQVCPVGEEVPQLWKCIPGGDGHCDSNDWTLVAENGTTGKTNFGDANNKQLSLLRKNGNYLYVGFDNPNGVEIWRTNVSNPSLESDFSQIGGDGLGDPATNLEIYSSVARSSGSLSYIYVSLGKNSQPVKIYRQQNETSVVQANTNTQTLVAYLEGLNWELKYSITISILLLVLGTLIGYAIKRYKAKMAN
ncbi:MAG: Ig-like domain-containing protein [Leptospiraceae bacterium]|nr:Ig-like domain-containing protein [Leptospiraceae bacterium]